MEGGGVGWGGVGDGGGGRREEMGKGRMGVEGGEVTPTGEDSQFLELAKLNKPSLTRYRPVRGRRT